MKTKEEIQRLLNIKMINQRENIAKVLDGQKNIFSAKEIMEIYTQIFNYESAIYNYVIEGDKANSYQGMDMYQLYKDYHTKFLSDSFVIARKSHESEKKLIEEVLNQEQLFEYHTRNLISYFSYLDRSYVELNNSNINILKLKKQAKKLFFEQFYSKLSISLQEQLRAKLQQERELKDKEVQRVLERLFRIVVEMRTFQDQQLYTQIQDHIREDSRRYYEESYKMCSEKNILEQIQLLIQLKSEELERIATIFQSDQQFQLKLNYIFAECLIERFAEDLSQNTSDILSNLIDQNYFDEFHQLIQFFNNLQNQPKLNCFIKKFKQIIISKGEAIVTERKSSPPLNLQGIEGKKQQQSQVILIIMQYFKYIEQLTNLQQFYFKLIENYAENNQILNSSLLQVMEHITNQDQNFVMDSILAILNTFILKRLDRDNEALLISVMQLFQSLQQKDLLLRNYQNGLARRLLTNINLSIDVEKKVIEQFRKFCGPEHSKKLDLMVRDYEQQETQNQINLGGIEIKPKILKAEYWPDIQPQFAINNLQFFQLKEAFLQHFISQSQKNSQLDIKWQDQISMVELTFETNTLYKVIIGSAGGAVLLDFNMDNTPRHLPTLQQKLNIESLYFDKQIKLLKTAGLIVLTDNQGIKFNENYANKFRNIPIGFMLDFKMEYQQDELDTDRKIAIQAAIVRIMKAKKFLTFQQVNSLVKEHLRMFQPKDADIKNVIEFLINQEYLKRNPQNMSELIYVS